MKWEQDAVKHVTKLFEELKAFNYLRYFDRDILQSFSQLLESYSNIEKQTKPYEGWDECAT